MTRRQGILATAAITVLVSLSAAQAPSKPTQQDERGMTSYLEFGGTSDSDGQAYELNSSVGYNFSPHFGIAVGAPFYFLSPSSSSGGSTTSGVGNPYLGMHLKYPGDAVNFSSGLTGSAPIGDSKKGLSTGRATFDWNNRFDHAFSDLTPFVEVGVANTIADTRLYVRPYTTLGFNTHFQGGASYDIGKFFSVGGLGYDILPSGQQTIFSRITGNQGNTGAVKHGRVFENNQQTTGSASLAQDDGFSTFVDINPHRAIDMEVGFTRSFVYDLNSVSFNIGFNLRQLYRSDKK